MKEGEFGHGKVRVENGMLVVDGGQPVAGLACSREVPKTDYELAFETKYDGATAVFCQLVFPIGEASCMLDVGGYTAMRIGLEYFDGMPPDGRGSPADKVMKFDPGRWYSVRLRVTKTDLAYWIDDEKLFETPLAGHNFGIAPRWNVLKPLGLLTGNSKLSIRSFRVRTIGKE